MAHVWTISAVFVSLILCACAGKDREAPASRGDAAVASSPGVEADSPEAEADGAEVAMDREPEAKPGECEALLRADDVSIQHRGQGSHGAATTDATLDLATGRLHGTSYTLDDTGTPVPIGVDQAVDPEALAGLRELLGSICARREVAERDEHAAPGGSTELEIKHADGTSLVVIFGASNLPTGTRFARTSREEWTQIFDLWPEYDKGE